MKKYLLLIIGLVLIYGLIPTAQAMMAPGMYQILRNEAELVVEGKVKSAMFEELEGGGDCKVDLSIETIYRQPDDLELSDDLQFGVDCFKEGDDLIIGGKFEKIENFTLDSNLRIYLNKNEDNFEAVSDGIIYLDYPEYKNFDTEDVRPLIEDLKLPLSDIKKGSSDYETIAALWLRKVINGYHDGTFRINDPMTRAELLKVMIESNSDITSKQKDAEPAPELNAFVDVREDDWFYKYVVIAREIGWIAGYLDPTTMQLYFEPNQSIKKVEALKIILEGFGIEIDVPEETVSRFTDIDQEQWYYTYLYYAEENNLLSDQGAEFNPADKASRGWISEILYRLYLKQLSPIPQIKDEEVPVIEEKIIFDKEASPEEFSFIDYGTNLSQCYSRSIVSHDLNYVVWNYRENDGNAVYLANQAQDSIQKIIEIDSNDYINAPAIYTPFKFNHDFTKVYLYRESCNLDGYNLFNYFADEVLAVDLDSGEISLIVDLDFGTSVSGKFLNIADNDKKIAYFYSTYLRWFQPSQTWIKVKDIETELEEKYDMPFFVTSEQQFGEGYFSPSNNQLAYMITTGDLPDKDQSMIIVLDLRTGKSKKVAESLKDWSGKWLLTGWENDSSLSIYKTEIVDGETNEIFEVINL